MIGEPLTIRFIKIVPDSAPNADGEWIACPTQLVVQRERGWRQMEADLIANDCVPAGCHVVSVSSKEGEW